MSGHPLFPPHLDAGSSGPAVRFLQCLLLSLELNAGEDLVPDGEYGPVTVAAVKEFQGEVLGMPEEEIDGNFGPRTRETLFEVFGASDSDSGIDVNVIPASAFPGTTTWYGPGTEGPQTWPPAETSDTSDGGIPPAHRADGSVPMPCA